YQLVTSVCTGSSLDGGNGTPGGQFGEHNGVQLGDGDIISCTFYNKPAEGTLNVTKVINDQIEKTANVPSMFTLNVSEATTSPYTVPFAATTTVGIADPGVAITLPGDTYYVVSEPNPMGYAPSFSAGCSGNMPVDGDVNCTVTNNQIPEGAA